MLRVATTLSPLSFPQTRFLIFLITFCYPHHPLHLLGYGSLIGYLDKSRVTAYIAVEPNAHMHSRLRQTASKAGFQEENGSFLLIPCGAENIDTILAALSAWSTGPGRERIVSQTGTIQSPEGAKTYNGYIVNTLVSILTLCSIPEPQNTLRALVRNVLLPGGQFIFSEHVRSPLKDVAWWQDVVAPIWRLCFDGCIIGRDSMKVIREAANEVTGNSDERQGWESMETWSEDEMDSESMFWIQLGACVKRGGNETAFHAI